MIVLWLLVFLAGTVVASAPYRAQLATFEGSAGQIMKNAGMVLLTYTLTNVALLCLFASMLGMLASRAVLTSDAEAPASPPDLTCPRNSALLRGFFVYLALIGGVLVLSEKFAEPTQGEYVRLAGLISLIAFMVNYQPAICGGLLNRAAKLVGQGKPSEDESEPAKPQEPTAPEGPVDGRK
jgi:hypothetical protein